MAYRHSRFEKHVFIDRYDCASAIGSPWKAAAHMLRQLRRRGIEGPVENTRHRNTPRPTHQPQPARCGAGMGARLRAGEAESGVEGLARPTTPHRWGQMGPTSSRENGRGRACWQESWLARHSTSAEVRRYRLGIRICAKGMCVGSSLVIESCVPSRDYKHKCDCREKGRRRRGGVG